MPTCPKCNKLCKTAQGLGGHMRFRHQMTLPKQSLQAYAQDRIERGEAENAKLHEQLARSQRRNQDLETFYDKKVEEQNAQMGEMQRKTAGQHVESVKHHDERSRLQQTPVEERAAFQKQVQEHQKQVVGLELQIKELTEQQRLLSAELERRLNQGQKPLGVEELRSELERVKGEMAQNANRRRSLPPPPLLPPLPPRPDPLRPLSSIRELAGWLHRFRQT